MALSTAERVRRSRERKRLAQEAVESKAKPDARVKDDTPTMRAINAGTAARGTAEQREAELDAFAAGMAAQAFTLFRQGAMCAGCEQRVDAVDGAALVRWVDGRKGMWRYFDWLRREGLVDEWDVLRRASGT